MSGHRADTGDDLAYQDRILPGVSRTFALTIPQLPGALARVVANAYLLCRIADTIEDEPGLDPARKQSLSEAFVAVVAGEAPAEAFADELGPLLTAATLDSERDLVGNTPRVIRLTRSFRPRQRAALERCVRVMSRGMAEFQRNASLAGLPTMRDLDRYCYHVAGVVGEMLTELFCDHADAIDARRDDLQRLAVSFGQGLQMTNILKDLWEDRRRGACWLPRDVFARAGFDLATLEPGHYDPRFGRGLEELIGVARMHLDHALEYTLLIPRGEAGIRRFCLWALGMAVLSLRKLHGRLDFQAGAEVKISRASVRGTVAVTSLAACSDTALRTLFDAWTRPLPVPARGDKALSA